MGVTKDLHADGVPVVFHASNSGYNHIYGTHWSENPDNPSHHQSPPSSMASRAFTERLSNAISSWF